jgi:hypothetical protein
MKRTIRTPLLATCLVALAGASAIASGVGVQNQTSGSGKKLVAVSSVDSPDELTLSNGYPTWTTLLTTQVNVPSKAVKALIDASFQTSSQCIGGNPGNWCLVRILVDGNEMNPATGLGSIFDTVTASGAPSNMAAHVLQRSLTVGPGSHTVTVQATPSGDGTSMHIDDMELQVEAYQ